MRATVLLCATGVLLTAGCLYEWPIRSVDPDGSIDGAVTGDASTTDGAPADASDSTTPGCGNGIIETGEQCDDGNTTEGDGCSPSCRVDTGWYCSSEPSQCVTMCGDNIQVLGEEQCDDGNQEVGDGCNADCEVDCSNASTTDCNAAGSTLNPSAIFVDPAPPPGFVQCGGFKNTSADDVTGDWDTLCLGSARTLRVRVWNDLSQDLMVDATLSPASSAAYVTQTFDASNHAGSIGLLESLGAVLLKDAPGESSPSFQGCDLGGPTDDYGATDLVGGSLDGLRTLYVCGADSAATAHCSPAREIIWVTAGLGVCTPGVAAITDVTVALYYSVQ